MGLGPEMSDKHGHRRRGRHWIGLALMVKARQGWEVKRRAGMDRSSEEQNGMLGTGGGWQVRLDGA